MNPFTLEWWFTKYEQVRLREKVSFDNSNVEDEIRYALLGNWIQRRIINKYGE